MERILYGIMLNEISKRRKKGTNMGSAVSVIMMILIALVGGLPTIAITACIPVMIAWKCYRKLKYGYSLYY